MQQDLAPRGVAKIDLLTFRLRTPDNIGIELQHRVRDADFPQHASEIFSVQSIADYDDMLLQTPARSEVDIFFGIFNVEPRSVLKKRLDHVSDPRRKRDKEGRRDHRDYRGGEKALIIDLGKKVRTLSGLCEDK